MKNIWAWVLTPLLLLGCSEAASNVDSLRISPEYQKGYTKLVKMAPDCARLDSENYASCEVASRMLIVESPAQSTDLFVSFWGEKLAGGSPDSRAIQVSHRIFVPVLGKIYQAGEDGYSRIMEDQTERIQLASAESLEFFRTLHTESQRSTDDPSQQEVVSLLLEDIFFDVNQSTVHSGARFILEKTARQLQEHPWVQVVIEGYSDRRGSGTHNRALALRRAEAARQFLVEQGVEASRMTTMSYGEEQPLCADQNEDCWMKNRRVHFLVDTDAEEMEASTPSLHAQSDTQTGP